MAREPLLDIGENADFVCGNPAVILSTPERRGRDLAGCTGEGRAECVAEFFGRAFTAEPRSCASMYGRVAVSGIWFRPDHDDLGERHARWQLAATRAEIGGVDNNEVRRRPSVVADFRHPRNSGDIPAILVASKELDDEFAHDTVGDGYDDAWTSGAVTAHPDGCVRHLPILRPGRQRWHPHLLRTVAAVVHRPGRSPSSRPASLARLTSSARFWTLSFWWMWDRWVSTVRTDTNSCRPISALV